MRVLVMVLLQGALFFSFPAASQAQDRTASAFPEMGACRSHMDVPHCPHIGPRCQQHACSTHFDLCKSSASTVNLPKMQSAVQIRARPIVARPQRLTVAPKVGECGMGMISLLSAHTVPHLAALLVLCSCCAQRIKMCGSPSVSSGPTSFKLKYLCVWEGALSDCLHTAAFIARMLLEAHSSSLTSLHLPVPHRRSLVVQQPLARSSMISM